MLALEQNSAWRNKPLSSGTHVLRDLYYPWLRCEQGDTERGRIQSAVLCLTGVLYVDTRLDLGSGNLRSTTPRNAMLRAHGILQFPCMPGLCLRLRTHLE